MIVSYNDVTGPVTLRTPKGEAEAFIEWLLNTNTWKEYPDVLYDKALRVRKRLLEQSERRAKAVPRVS